MESKEIAILLSRIETGASIIYTPRKAIVGNSNGEIFLDTLGNKYFAIGNPKCNNENTISFKMSIEILEKIFCESDINDIMDKYMELIAKYKVILENDRLTFLYGNDELIPEEELMNHFKNLLLGNKNDNHEEESFNPIDLYDALKSRVFMQDDAIKKVFLALTLHYMDNDGVEKANIIIDGGKGTGKTEIINTLRDNMPISVLVENLGDVNFSFDSLFFSLQNDKKLSDCPILVLDNADKLILGKDSNASREAINIIKHLMLGEDYKLSTSSGTVNFPTKDFSVIVVGDFSKRPLIGINNYAEGVPEELSKLTNYNITMNSVSRDMVYAKLMDKENGPLAHYARILDTFNVRILANKGFIDKVIDQVMATNMHELNKIVEKCIEEILFEVLTDNKGYHGVGLTEKTVTNNKKYLIKK